MNMADFNNKLHLRANAVDNISREYHFSIEFFVFQEGGNYIAYCPALDISTCASSYNEAISGFYEMFQLHVECCVESGTLYDDLLAHGWKLKKKTMQPPTLVSMMKKPELKKLFSSNISFERVVAPARIPVLS